MTSMTFGVFGENPEKRGLIASAIGKKDTVEDITLYQTVFSGKIISVIEPTKYPEKVQVAVYAAYLSDYCILQADALTPSLGELIVILDALQKKEGCIITDFDLKPLIKGTSLENYPIFPTFEQAKEHILAYAPQNRNTETIFASVDHSFEVKGVGSILLGFLHSGKIKIHDKLQTFPSGKELEVRSIQMHDADVKETNAGDRFGLAIKLLTSKDVERGDFLASQNHQIKTGKELSVQISLSKFLKEPLKQDEQIHALHFFQNAPCRWNGQEAKANSQSNGKLAMEKPFSVNSNFPVLLARLDAKGLRVIGTAKLQ